MRLVCSGVARLLLLQKNVLRRQDMLAVENMLLPIICRPWAVQRCHIGLYVVEEGRLQLLQRCMLPAFTI